MNSVRTEILLTNFGTIVVRIGAMIKFGIEAARKDYLKFFLIIQILTGTLALAAIDVRQTKIIERFFPHILDFNYVCLATIMVLAVTGGFLVLGCPRFSEDKRMRKLFAGCKLLSINGKPPKMLSLVCKDSNNLKMTFYGPGLHVKSFRELKAKIESARKLYIERIDEGSSSGVVTISFSGKCFPERLNWTQSLVSKCKNGEFLVGVGRSGPVYGSLEKTPHILVAGTTGGGKSCFFRQVILTLLRKSPSIRVHLLDLKHGVEGSLFSGLKGVTLSKTIDESAAMILKLKSEMHDRFEYMEEKGLTKIDPEKEGMPRIVIAIDECSILFHESSKALEAAKDISRLGRAACVHLILATQKVTRDTVSTAIQENGSGRMCFRTSTLQNSVAMLGDGRAFDLPQIAGRGIWDDGSERLDIQTPWVSDDRLQIRKELEQTSN